MWSASDAVRRLPRQLRCRRADLRNTTAVRGAGADSHDPALRSFRPGRCGARLMQCGDFRVSYAADERIFETRLPVVVLVLILMIRPYGLFGRADVERV